MTELLTAAQMRAIEQAAIESGEVTGLELMERAGQGVVDAIFAEWPELAPVEMQIGGQPPNPQDISSQKREGAHRVVVLCGPGNNGGDGFVVARLLKGHGWEVDVFLYGDADKLPPDARVNYERWVEYGEVARIDKFDAWKENYALVVDAVFGIGLSRAVNNGVLAAIRDASAIERTVALDMISGICTDSGRELQQMRFDKYPYFVDTDLCVTFHCRKIGHVLANASVAIKKLAIVDIGLDRRDALRHLGFLPSKDGGRKRDVSIVVKMPESEIYTPEFLGGHSILDKDWNTHKYSHGHALILSGGVGKGGAARLSARGALRIGAGAVTLGVPPAALIENAAQLNAIMLKPIRDAADLSETLQDSRINALCIGPGLGLGDREAQMLRVALDSTRPGLDPGPQTDVAAGDPGSRPGRGLVLDADALTVLAQDETLFVKLHSGCILTPHVGEFARLFPDIAAKLDAPATKGPAYSKVDATRDAAKRAGCLVLFKGPDTVIADPSGRCSLNASLYERSAPWLATAGSGDVLAGFITGLLARGFAPMQAAETGAWLHTECALHFGPGLIAEDLPEELPKVFRALGL